MNLERLLELVFNNPENISIEYSNINGQEKLVVNGEELTEKKESFDDSKIKEDIKYYKENVNNLDEWVWDIVMDEAEKRNFNLKEMDRILNLDSYTEEEAMQAFNTMSLMKELIQEILKHEIQSLVELMERF